MFSDPEKNVDQFGLNERMTIADLGAGSGAYTIAAARKVQNFGKVYAVEVQKELATRIKNLAIQQGLSNVEALWGDIERLGGTKLGDHSVDGVIVSNVLFQVEDRDGTMSEISRILKPGGKLYLIDWKESFGGMGPAADAVFTQEAAEALLVKAGFEKDRTIEVGAHHYGIIAHKKGGRSDEGNGKAFENSFGDQ